MLRIYTIKIDDPSKIPFTSEQDRHTTHILVLAIFDNFFKRIHIEWLRDGDRLCGIRVICEGLDFPKGIKKLWWSISGQARQKSIEYAVDKTLNVTSEAMFKDIAGPGTLEVSYVDLPFDDYVAQEHKKHSSDRWEINPIIKKELFKK